MALATEQLNLSFTRLAELTRRQGGLRQSYFGPNDGQEGIRAHQKCYAKLADQYGAALSTEGAVSLSYHQNGDSLLVRGRYDALLHLDQQHAVLYEIKSFRADPSLLPVEGDDLHWAQAMFYAHALLQENPDWQLDIVLLYEAVDQDLSLEHRRNYTAKELQHFFQQSCQIYLRQLRNVLLWKRQRDLRAQTARFPFPVLREGQKDMMRDILACLRDRSQIIIEAPTGIGKTLASLYPSLKALSRGYVNRIFYATAMTSTRKIVLEALNHLREKGHFLCRSLCLESKEKLCPHKDLFCDLLLCPCAVNFYQRLPEALNDLLSYESITADEITLVAQHHELCPFELSLEAALFCDLVVGDYNHLFDPKVRLRRLLADDQGPVALLVDEAHNLPARARTMISAELSSEKIRLVLEKLQTLLATPQLKKTQVLCEQVLATLNWARRIMPLSEAHQAPPPQHASEPITEAESLENCETSFSDTILQERERDDFHSQAAREDFVFAPDFLAFRAKADLLLSKLGQLVYCLRQCLDLAPNFPGRQEVLRFWFDLLHFCRIADSTYDNSFITALRPQGQTDINLYLLALDAASYLRSQYENYPTVFFSATLSPLAYYEQLLGLTDLKQHEQLCLASPFLADHCLYLACTRYDLSYRGRRRSLPAVLDLILEIARLKKGNYLIFCPSFSYLAELRHELKIRPREQDLDFMLQVPSMSDKQKKFYLQRFEDYGRKSLLAFAVLGSLFNEGIDLQGERLSGVIVLGAGLPGLSPEREILSQYYQQKLGQAFLYAYLYPGFNRVQQAVGRLIRSENDQGVVILIDERWSKEPYHELASQKWPLTLSDDLEFLLERLKDFWLHHDQAQDDSKLNT